MFVRNKLPLKYIESLEHGYKTFTDDAKPSQPLNLGTKGRANVFRLRGRTGGMTHPILAKNKLGKSCCLLTLEITEIMI